MGDLVRWLTAQLDADRVEAEKLADDDDYGLDASTLRWEETGEWNGYPYLRVSKARVLREIDAKRELLRRYTAMAEGVLVMTGVDAILSEYRRVILPNLALPYADREGYRAEWRP